MKPRPKIAKSADGWTVKRPGYGFAGERTDGPYPSHADALASLATGTASAGPIIERTNTPTGSEQSHSYIPFTPWPLEIR